MSMDLRKSLGRVHKGELAVLAFFLLIVCAMLYVGLVINTPWWADCSSVTPPPYCG